MTQQQPESFSIAGETIRPGETRDVLIKISESFTGSAVHIPARVIHSQEPGPAIFVTGAVHGDEINGTGIVRELMFGENPAIAAGTLICVPVTNILGFERQSRYLPDRRDLNRQFPGSEFGSSGARIAYAVFHEIVSRCEYGIDLHSASNRRTNFPQIRADMSDEGSARIARAFGADLIINKKGPADSLRREALKVGCSVITLEAGQCAKIEPAVVEIGVRGIRNVLVNLGMLPGETSLPPNPLETRRTVWVRSDHGGLLRFHVEPGDIVSKGDPICSIEDVFGEGKYVLISPKNGLIMGVTTLPVVRPGYPVCHIAISRKALSPPEPAAHFDRKGLKRELAAGVVVEKNLPRTE